MNKTLIAIAAGAALALPMAASAEVTVYGMAQAEIASFDDDADSTRGIEVVDQARGRIGLKASEDLGNGLKGIAKFEFKADTADGVASGSAIALSPRESFAGLKGSFGQIELGRLKSEYKYTGGVKYDPFVATTLEARRNGGMSGGSLGHNGFLTESFAYRGQAGPVKLGITYAPGEDDGLMSAAAKLGGKQWEAFVAVIDNGDRNGTTSTDPAYSSVKLGGKYKIGGMHTISGQFEMTDPDQASGEEPTFLFIGYQLKMGKTILVAQIGVNDADSATGVGDKDYLAVGAIHKFSKKTRVFGGIRSTSPDTGTAASTDVSVISVGIRKDF